VTDPEDRFLGEPADPPVDKALDPDVAEPVSGEAVAPPGGEADQSPPAVNFYDQALAAIQKWSSPDSPDRAVEPVPASDESVDPFSAMSTPEGDSALVDITEPAAEPEPAAGAPDPAPEPDPEPQPEPAPGAAMGEGSGEDGEIAAEASEPNELDSPERLRAAVEAILLVVDTPTESMLIAQVLDRPVNEIEAALGSLRTEYDTGERGMDLREVAGGWRLYTREDFAGYIERFVLEGQQTRLTQAALETLAVIAYRQPITRSRVSAIRGVNVDAVMRTLLTRGLVEECGSDSETGGGLYQTTAFFLERLGISSLEELPSLAPLLPDTSQLDDVALST
jgi:segregation and condensation protein B